MTQKKKTAPKMKAARKVNPPVCGICGATGGTEGHAVDALGNVSHPWPEPARKVELVNTSVFPCVPAPAPEVVPPVKRLEVCPKCKGMSFIPNIRVLGELGKRCCSCFHWWPNTQAPVYNEGHFDFKKETK